MAISIYFFVLFFFRRKSLHNIRAIHDAESWLNHSFLRNILFLYCLPTIIQSVLLWTFYHELMAWNPDSDEHMLAWFRGCDRLWPYRRLFFTNCARIPPFTTLLPHAMTTSFKYYITRRFLKTLLLSVCNINKTFIQLHT